MKKLTKLIIQINDKLSWVGMVTLVVMMLLISTDVFLRYAFNSPITGSYEFVMILQGFVVLTAFSYTQNTNSHISITMLIRLLPSKIRLLCVVLGAALSAFMGVVLTIGAWKQAVKALHVMTETTTLQIKLFPIYFICCLLMGFFALSLLFYFVKTVYALFDKDTAEELEADWV